MVEAFEIKLTYAQVSFIWNNLDVDCHLHGWWGVFIDDFREFDQMPNTTVFKIQLDKMDTLYFNQDMKDNAEEILRQLKMDVFYGSFNDTSTHNTMWCLEMTSDIIRAINNALNNK